MRRLSIVTAILVVLAIALYAGFFRAPDILARNLSKKLGVPVSIGSIHFGTSNTEVENIKIDNPSSYGLSKAFSADAIRLSIPATKLLSADIDIDQINVDNIYLGIEFDSKTSAKGNWTEIFSTFQAQPERRKSGKKEVSVNRLIFRNIHSEIRFRDSGVSKQLPIIGQIELRNVSTKGGGPTDQLMKTALAQMLKEVFIRQNINNMLKEIILDTPGKSIDTFLKPFKKFFNSTFKEGDKTDV